MPGLPASLLLCVLCASLFAAERAGAGAELRPIGQDGGRPQPEAPKAPGAAPAAQAMIRDYEPWVKTARIGDFLVKRFPDGRTGRQEVTAMSPEFVTVAFFDQKATRLGDVLYRRRPEVQKSPGAPSPLPEPELKQKSPGRIDVGGRVLKCVVYAGRSCTGFVSISGRRYEMWGAIERHIAPEVPFGGVIKELCAKSMPVQIVNGKVDGWQQAAAEGGTVRLINPGSPTETAFEVIDFGNGRAGGK